MTMDARAHRGWNHVLSIVVAAASGLTNRLGPEWTSLAWVIRAIPLLPSNSLELINRCVGERVVTLRCNRRPLRVLEITARWHILSLGVFVRLARQQYALWSRWSREDRRRRIRLGEYGSRATEGPPEPLSDSDERPRFFVRGTGLTWVDPFWPANDQLLEAVD